jgi:SPP1 gp7 family putative phage head morphogenesis protein
MGILLDAFSLTPAKAVEYLRKKNLRISGAWYTVWREQHTRAFTVANCAKLDVLQDIRNMITAAIDGEWMPDSSGERVKRAISFGQFKKELVPRLKKAGWWGIEEITDADGNVIERQLGSVRRLETIYRTNTQVALNAGRYRGQIEAVRDLPYWQYVSILDGGTTDRCRGLHGKIFRADDSIWDVIYPPNHWGCRSRVRALTGSDGGEILTSNSGGMKHIEKTGVVGSGDAKRQVTVRGLKYMGEDGQPREFYPDAGLDYNPGKQAFTPDLKRYDADIAALFNGGEK